MQDKELLQYLANILHVIYIDQEAKTVEERYINRIVKELGGRAAHIAKAFELYRQEDYQLSFPFRYSDQLRNFEDMVRVALADKKFEKLEKSIIREAIQKLELSQAQVKRIYDEAKASVLQVA